MYVVTELDTLYDRHACMGMWEDPEEVEYYVVFADSDGVALYSWINSIHPGTFRVTPFDGNPDVGMSGEVKVLSLAEAKEWYK